MGYPVFEMSLARLIKDAGIEPEAALVIPY